MRYLFAVFVPPLAILSCGKSIAFIVNLIVFALAWAFFFAAVGLMGIPFGVIVAILVAPLGVAFWLLSVFHAMFVVANYADDRRQRELPAGIERPSRLIEPGQ